MCQDVVARRRTTFLLLLAVAISGALVVATLPGTAMGNGHAFQYHPGATSRNSLESAGKWRQFLVHVPASYRPGDVLPLILNFHGYESSAAQQEDISEMSVLSESEGFIVVYPEGLGRPQAWQTGLERIGEEDRVFVGDLINLLRDELDVDPNRVYATGFSNGAQMANRLMCEMADVFAAVAPVSGSFPPEETCRPSRPVPIVVFHGTADTTLPVPYDEIRDWLTRWAERTNGCAPAPTVTYRNGAVTGETWAGCRDDAEIVLFTVQGGGHSWPGTSSETTYLDPPNHDIQASRAIWDFFAAHPLPHDASSPHP